MLDGKVSNFHVKTEEIKKVIMNEKKASSKRDR